MQKRKDLVFYLGHNNNLRTLSTEATLHLFCFFKLLKKNKRKFVARRPSASGIALCTPTFWELGHGTMKDKFNIPQAKGDKCKLFTTTTYIYNLL